MPPGERIAVADGRGYAIVDAVSGRRLVVRTTDAPCHRVFSSSTRSGLRFAVDHSAETFALDLTDGDGIPISRIATPTADPPWQTRQHLVVAFSGDGARVALQTARRGYAPRIELFDTSTGQTTATCDSPGAVLLWLAFSPDGSRLATALESSQLFCFDSATGNRVATLSGHVGSLRAVAYSPDGRHLASCGDDQTIRVWDAETGTMRRTIRGHAGRVNSVAFSPDSRRLVTGGDDGTVRLWTADDGEGRLVLHGHTAAVNRVAFSDDGRTIASASSDGTARIWDATAPEDACILRHRGHVYPVAFSSDGRRIASGSWDGKVRLWDAVPRQPDPLAGGRITRRSARWRSAPMEPCWRPGARTGRSASGTPRPATRSTSSDTKTCRCATRSIAWSSARTADGSERLRNMGSVFGTW